MCATLSVVQSFVSFHLLSLCPPLPTDNTYTLHCVSTCSPVVQFLRVASRCSSTLLTPEVPQPQPTDSSSCRGEGQGRGSLHRHRGTQQDHPSTSHPSESCYGDVCGAVMYEECGGWVYCVLVLQTIPCSQHCTHCVNQPVLVCMCCIVQGMCLKPLLVVTVIHCWSSGFLTTSCSTRSPKWLVGTHCTSTGPPTAYWGWTSTWVGGAGDGVEVNIGGVEWGG